MLRGDDPIRIALPLTLAVFALLLGLQLLVRPLLPIDETRYLSVAWEMYQSGDIAHLTRNLDPYSHKPPLLFWLINLVWLVTGVSEFAARLIGPAFALGAVALTAGLARMLWPADRGIGRRAALILASFSIFAIYGSATMFDAMLAVAVLAGIWTLWRIGLGEAGGWDWVLFGLCLALGTYAKGPVILVHLAIPFLTLRLWAPNPPAIRHIARGGAMALVVALGLVALWLVPTLLTASPEFRAELLWTQSAARVAGGMAHDRPIWFLAVLLPLLLFPWAWSLGVWPALTSAVRGDGAGRLCLIWAASGLILFSLISGKQVHYLLPEFPAVALLFARAFGEERLAGRVRHFAPILLILLGIGLLAAAAGIIAPSGDMALLLPRIAVVAVALLAFAVAVISWATPGIGGPVVAGMGLVIVLHALIAGTGLRKGYDGGDISARLSAAEAGGLALTGMRYNAEFNFMARLTQKVATPATAEGLVAWAKAYPNGLIFGPNGSIDAPPEATERYNRIEYGFWPASALTSRE
ncbi:MAG: glycosyltransferase family 39 protein [Proteobacteria bacterium]|nr:glycosyltransferase family 39 protein [Pseudomonadota bacterium]